MTYPFVFYSCIALTFYTAIFVTGDSTEDCDEKYRHLSGDCRPLCKSQGAGFHRTFSCNHYCFCRDKKAYGVHRTCPDGMVFNHLIEHCDYPENYKCPDRYLLPVNYKCPKPEGLFEYPGCCPLFVTCDDDTPSASFCLPKHHFSVETGKCEYPENAGCRNQEKTTPEPAYPKCNFECPGDGSFPHPNECSKYCDCISGTPNERECDPGLHFSQTKKICTDPYTARCEEPTPEPDRPKCNFECPDSGLFPHPSDCTKYCHCSNNIPYENVCSASLHFNPKKKTCDYPSSAGCEPKCNFECPDNGLFPHPSDCTKYCHCKHKIPYENICSPPFHFNRKTKKCDYPLSAGCDTTAVETDFKKCDFVCPSVGLFPHPYTCEYYCECINDIPQQRECTQEMHFNRKTKACDDPFKALCDATFVTCPEESGVFPHLMRDDWYIYCESGYAKIYHCDNGDVFNLQFKVCLPPGYEKKK